MCMFYSLFALFLLTILLSVPLRCTDSDYPFGIFWPFCCLFLFDIRILITPLVSSNSFCFNVQLHCFLYPDGGALCSNILFDLVTSVFVILTCVGQLDIVFVPFFLLITEGK